ncbi:hypothetical protein AS593_19745 [Caulobacter vibrioides]|nr:hypothetical protein AS593_19745 [Caulobacter vibrioides]
MTGPGLRPPTWWRALAAVLIVGAGLSWPGVRALAQTPSPQNGPPPFVRVETGAHEAFVNRIAWLDRNRLLSVSDDQTARFWTPGRQGVARVVRGLAGPQDQGALYAMAASDKYIALGGRAGADAGDVFVRLLDRRTGKPAGLLSGLPDAVSALAFSPDGGKLAVGFNQRGVRVYALGDGRPRLERDTRGGTVSDLAFVGGEVLIAIESERGVRRYDLTSGEDRLWALPADFRPWRAEVSPDGGELAITSRARSAFATMSLTDGTSRIVPVGGGAGAWPTLAWSMDGASLVLGGRDAQGGVLRRVSAANGTLIEEIRTSDSAVTAVASGPAGVAYGEADGAIGLWRPGRPIEPLSSPAKLSFRAAGSAPLSVSSDGTKVALSNKGRPFALLDMGGRRVTALTGPPSGLAQRTAAAPAQIARLRGLEPDEKVLDAAVLDGDRLLVGTNFHLRLAGPDGRSLWTKAASAPVWAVAVSGDGRSAIAALGDGVVIWSDVRTGEVRLSAFVASDLRWVAWTPQGFFDRSTDGGRLIGYQVNRAPREEADFLDLDRMSRVYFRSDLVQDALRGASADVQRLADAGRRAGRPEDRLAGAPPPDLSLERICGVDAGKITACFEGQESGPTAVAWNRLVSSGQVDVTLRARSRDGGAMGATSVRVNGVAQAPKIIVQTAPDGELRRFRLDLPAGDVRLEMSVADATGALQSASTVITVADVQRGDRRPAAIRVLAVGVSDYALAEFDLERGVASNDAATVASRLSDVANLAYLERSSAVLKDDQATGSNIRAAFEKLVSESQTDDVVIIYLAGHGGQIAGDYVFAPYEIGATQGGAAALRRLEERQIFSDQVGEAMMAADGFKQAELADYLARLKARRAVLVLDTCFSGSFGREGLTRRRDISTAMTERLAQSSGRYVVAAARAFAIDNPETAGSQTGHTTFTGSVLRALGGEADRDRDGAVTLSELADYVREDVPRRTAGLGMEQTPVIDFVGNPYFNLIQSRGGARQGGGK